MFGQLLSEFRIRKRISKTRLAQLLNVTTGYVVNLESGRRKPPRLEKCHALARALGLTESESIRLVRYALRERLSEDSMQFIRWLGQHESSGSTSGVSDPRYDLGDLVAHCVGKSSAPDRSVVASAIGDPMAREALLRTHTDVEWRRLIEYLLSVSPSKSVLFLSVFQQIFSLMAQKEERFEAILNQ